MPLPRLYSASCLSIIDESEVMGQDPFYIPSVGECIYRDRGEPAHQGPLTDEHIVPFGLGGTGVFREASCKACAKVTAKFEGVVQRTILGPCGRE